MDSKLSASLPTGDSTPKPRVMLAPDPCYRLALSIAMVRLFWQILDRYRIESNPWRIDSVTQWTNRSWIEFSTHGIETYRVCDFTELRICRIDEKKQWS